MSALQILGDDIYLRGGRNYNLFTFRKNTEEDQIDLVGNYRLGEFINRFQRCFVKMRLPVYDVVQIPTVIFGTDNGVIGVIFSLPLNHYGFLEKLQANLRMVIKRIGGINEIGYPARNFLDGDLIESFLDLDRSSKDEISKAMDVSVEKLCKTIGDLIEAKHNVFILNNSM